MADALRAETGRRILAIPCDLKDLDACAALVERTAGELGGLDALVNVATHPFPQQRIADFDWSSYEESVRLNIMGTMKVCGEAARRMGETGGGGIVNVGTLSTTALLPGLAEYTSTKAAMIAMSKTLAGEVGRQGVRVNVVTPGYTTGAPLDQLMAQMGKAAGLSGPAMSERVADRSALARHVDPEDIAEACLYLCSERARNVTGIELHVTAGAMIV